MDAKKNRHNLRLGVGGGLAHAVGERHGVGWRVRWMTVQLQAVGGASEHAQKAHRRADRDIDHVVARTAAVRIPNKEGQFVEGVARNELPFKLRFELNDINDLYN